ncbi:hypothetical protein NHX12_002065 [Muraenolepis orangiensis]|uniref:Fibronectin type-III domain-containing protein n=1 Tax=Muraenolepis orangiensis TaxID=630683 RepID=A0A9Q0IIR2_9TELE|nr:hypothetical protein NHX12_002065 [Muraenolepis orangiensis]
MESPTGHLRFELYTHDENHIIEDAVNSAIHAVLDAIYSVNCGQIVKYQSIVEERDREISRLEYKLRQNDSELRAMRGQRDASRRPEGMEEGSVAAGREGKEGYDVPAGEEDVRRHGLTVQRDFPSVSAERPPSLPCDPCDPGVDYTAAYSSHNLSDNREPSSSSSPWGRTDGIDSPANRYTAHATGPLVKEEPSGCKEFFIKLEMCEQSCGSNHQEDPDHPDHLANQSPTQREGLRACREKERSKYLKRRVLVAEMSEDDRRRKREMWRAAARRHRDRKMGVLLPHCPPAGSDLFDDWPTFDDAESPVTCFCNVSCTTDYEEYLECACSDVPPPSSVVLEAECSCLMRPDNFSLIMSVDTVCRVVARDPHRAPVARSAQRDSWWLLGDMVKTLPPLDVRVRRGEGSVNVSWDVDNYMQMPLRYRVRLRDPAKVRVFEETNQYLVMESSSLLPNTRYQVDIQASLSPDDGPFKGPWSAWSPTVDIMHNYKHKYDWNFKDWVRPMFSEAEVLMVAAPPVPVSDQKLLLCSPKGDPIDIVRDALQPGRPSFPSLHMVVLSGDERGPEPGPRFAVDPDPESGRVLLASYRWKPWDNDDDDSYPRMDLDTGDSGFGESECGSPFSLEGASSEEQAGFFIQDGGLKSNYIRQWMMTTQALVAPNQDQQSYVMAPCAVWNATAFAGPCSNVTLRLVEEASPVVSMDTSQAESSEACCGDYCILNQTAQGIVPMLVSHQGS